MKIRAIAVAGVALGTLALAAPAWAQTHLRVGWCTRTMSSSVAPFAVAAKMGWFTKAGVTVQLIPVPGVTDCTKLVATRELDTALVSVEPVAVIHTRGVRLRTYYTAYQGNAYGFAVPADSPIRSIADIRGKRVGVINMGSGGVLIARALATANGMDPDKDIHIVVAGEGAQTAALLSSN
ncbi:MAG TPA: ABC transporter substrate-binding protein, partial [bacterium]